MRAKLTDRYAAAAPAGLHWDLDARAPRGFLLRVTPAGARAWCLNFRLKDSGRERRLTIGSFPTWSVAQARERGHELRREIDAGHDPLSEAEQRRAEPTVAELIAEFKENELPARAPRTAAEYAAMLDRHVVPAIGRLKISAVEPRDIAGLHRRLSGEGKLRRANAVVTVTGIVFGWAVKMKMLMENPCRAAIKRNDEPGRERFLNKAELERLLAVLEDWREHRPETADALLLLAMTGSRRNEVLSMRWTDVDLDSAVWTKPRHLVKTRRIHRIPLAPEAVALLQRRLDATKAPGRVVPLRQDGLVFRGGGDAAHVARLERDWQKIRAAAGLEDVRIHDLRHSFASTLISKGLSLPIVGSLLGHSSPSMTARYSHLSDEVQREAAKIVGTIVGGKGAK